MALLPGSPAIEAGSTAFVTSGETDQRGQPRITGTAVDIGAYESQGLQGTSASDIYSLSNGNLYDTSINQLIATNVASFTPSQGELCYLQNSGQLGFFGDADPVAGNVASFAIDAAGAVLYLGLNGVVNALTVPRPLDNGTPVVLFKMDGAGSAVVLDQQGNLMRFEPGAATATTLDSTVTTETLVTFASGSTTITVVGSAAGLAIGDVVTGAGIAPGTRITNFSGSSLTVSTATTAASTRGAPGERLTATASVLNFAVDGVDGTGGVVELNSDGNLTRYAPGSDVAEPLNSDVSKFVIDAAGSIVALENTGTASVTLGSAQLYSTPAYNLVRFVPASDAGSLVKDVIDTGVTTMILDGAGSVVALDNLAQNSITLADGQVFSTPSYSMDRFAPGATVAQPMDAGVTQVAMDGAGSIVALDSLSQSGTVSLSDGQSSSSPVYTMVNFGPGLTTRNVIDTGVSRFVVNGAGSVVALDSFSSGSVESPQWDIASFAAPSYSRVLMDPAPVSSFVLDGSGSVVAQDSGLVRLVPGPAPGAYTRQALTAMLSGGVAEDIGTGTVVVDASGTLFTLSATNLVEFAPGSSQGSVVAQDVKQVAVDGSGSVVALDSRSTETLAGSDETATVYNLIRFAPGATTPTVIDSGVSQLVVDSSGSVVAKDSLSAGPNGPVGQLTLFTAGSSSRQPMAPIMNPEPGQNAGAPVSSFTVDGAGSVVALMDPSSLDTYTLARFAPGSTSPQQLDTNIGSFVLDGTGAIVALHQGSLERFAVLSTTAQPMPLSGGVTSYVVDGSGTVFAVANQELWSFSLGSTTAQQLAGGAGSSAGTFAGVVSQISVDGSGEVLALVAGDLLRYSAGGGSVQSILPNTQQFVVDGTGSVYALAGGTVYVFTPGATQPQENSNPYPQPLSELTVDASGTAVALDKSDHSLVIFSLGSPYAYQSLGGNDALPGDALHGGFVFAIGIDASGSVIALVNYNNGAVDFDGGLDPQQNSIIRFAPGLSTHSIMAVEYPATFFESIAGDPVVANVANYYDVTSRGAAPEYTLIEFAVGATEGVPVEDPNGNVFTTSNFAVDATGAIFAAYNGTAAFSDNTAAPSMVYSLVRIAPGATVAEPVLEPEGAPFENVSNFASDALGSVVVLDALSQTLYRFAPGSTTAASINAPSHNTVAFVVDGDGYVVAMEASQTNSNNNDLVQYAPGSSKSTVIDGHVQSFTIANGEVLALDTEAGVGEVVLFAAGSQARHVLDANDVIQMVGDINGGVDALEMPNPSSGVGTLVNIQTTGATLKYSNPVSTIFADRYGNLIAIDETNGSYRLVVFPGSVDPVFFFPPQVMVPSLVQVSVLPDGTILALSAQSPTLYLDGEPITNLNEPNDLFAYSPGATSSSINMMPVASNVQSFTVASGVQNYAQWQSQEGYEITHVPPPSTNFWQIFVQIVEVIGAAVATYFTAGAASPLVVAAVGAGDAILNETINHFAFGASFNLGSIGLGAISSAVGGAGGIIDSIDELGQNIGGVVGDVTDALDEAAGEISGTIGDLVGNVVNPDSFVGQALRSGFDSAVTKFLATGSLGQTANAALSSLENSVAEGALNSGFVQDTLSFLNDVAATGENAVQDGLDELNQIAADGLSGGGFGQTVASFLVNAVQNGLTGKPIFQDSLSFLGQVVSDGLGDSPFAQEAAHLVSQALTNGVNGNLANSLLSFVGQTAADGIANSSFVQDGLSFVNQALADGLGNSSLLQDGVNFLETTAANGLAGSTFSQQVSSFLQAAGVDGWNSLGSAATAEIGTFLQDATQGGSVFINSTLGGDIGSFLQQAAQDGSEFLDSSFVASAASAIDAAAQDIGSLGATVQANLGNFLRDAALQGPAFLNSELANPASGFLNSVAQYGASFLNSNFVSAAGAVLDQATQQITVLTPGVQAGIGYFLQQAAAAGSNFVNSTLGNDVTGFLNATAQAGPDFLNSSFLQGASNVLGDAAQQINSLAAAVQTNLGSFLHDAAQAGTSFANSTLGVDVGTFLNAAAIDGNNFINSPLLSGATAVLDEAVQQIGLVSTAVQTNLGAFLESTAGDGTTFVNSTLGADVAVAGFLNTAAQDGVNVVNSSLFAGASSLLQEATQQLSNMGSNAQAAIGSFLQDAAEAGTAFANSTLGTDVANFLNTAAQDGVSFLNSSFLSGASNVLGEAAQQINSLSPNAQASLGTFIEDAAMAGAGFANSTLGSDAGGFLHSAAQDGADFLDSNLIAGAASTLGAAAQQINSLSISTSLQASLGSFLQDAAQAGGSFANSTLGTDVGNFLNTVAQDGANFLNSSFVSGACYALQEATLQISSLGSVVQTNLGGFLENAATAGTTFLNSALGGNTANFLNIAAEDGLSFLNSSFASGASAVLGEAAQRMKSLAATVQANLGGFLQEAAAVGSAFVNSTLGAEVASFLTTAAQDGINFLNTSFLSASSAFLQQAAQDGVGFLNGNGAAFGAFLEQAAQAGSSFASSSLGADAGAFLQQAAQDGVDFLDMGFISGASAFLEEASNAGVSFLNGNGAGLGAFLQHAAQTGLSFASSSLGAETGAFLEQAAQDGVPFLTTNFVSGASAFLQQAAQDGVTFLNGNGATLGAFLEQAAQSGLWFASSTVGGDLSSFLSQAAQDGAAFLNSNFVFGAASFLNQVASSPSLAGSTFAANVVLFLNGVAGAPSAPSLASSPFATGAVSFVNQMVSEVLTNSVFAQGAATVLQQTVADGLAGLSLGSNILAFLDTVSSNGLANSTFAQQADTTLNQTLAAGATSGPAVQAFLTSQQASLPMVPLVTTQPISQTITAGQQATFTAAPSGTPTPSVQWQTSTDGVHFSNISGATSASYTFTASQAQDHAQYQAVFTNVGGSATTTPATLTVQTGPAVTTQPASQTITAGQQATFTAAASGTPTASVQWQISTSNGSNWSNITGANNSSYSFTVRGYPKTFRLFFRRIQAAPA